MMTEETKETVQEEKAANEEQTVQENNDASETHDEEGNEEPGESSMHGNQIRLNRKAVSAKLKEEVKTLTEKNEELRDKYLRLFADFDNYKKRAAKERLDTFREAGKDIVILMLPVLDDFERQMKTLEADANMNVVREGSQLIYNKLKNALEQKGLKKMETIGQEFNPDFHEAITEIPAPSEEMKGKVMDEAEKGYFLNDKIIRYAKVVVGK